MGRNKKQRNTLKMRRLAIGLIVLAAIASINIFIFPIKANHKANHPDVPKEEPQTKTANISNVSDESETQQKQSTFHFQTEKYAIIEAQTKKFMRENQREMEILENDASDSDVTQQSQNEEEPSFSEQTPTEETDSNYNEEEETLTVENESNSNSETEQPSEVETPGVALDAAKGDEVVITMTATAYCPNACCNGKYAWQTASGATMQLWRTVAAGYAYPFGTRFYIPYFADQPNGGWFVVEDRFADNSNPYIVDILMENDDVCNEFGRRDLEVYVYYP